MLVGLSIRDIVLVDRLELQGRSGLCVLTGETGAGKSILLDALGLALGGRGDAGLVRPSADQGVVSAEFEVAAGHPLRTLLDERGLDGGGDSVVLRRVLGADGRSRAFINDQSVSIGLLRQCGELLVEVHGQNDAQGLLDPLSHAALLDAFGGLESKRTACRTAYQNMRAAAQAVASAEAELVAARADEDYLRHVRNELQALDPQIGEEAELSERRALLMQAEKIAEGLNEADTLLAGPDGIDNQMRRAQRALERVAPLAAGRLEEALATLDRAADEVAEAVSAVEYAAVDLNLDPSQLERINDRLFALRDAARKHRTDVDSLPALRNDFAGRIQALDVGSETLETLKGVESEAREAYAAAARALTAGRTKAAKRLDKAVAAELKPLKLGNATFRTNVEALAESDWSADGADRVQFLAATVKGASLAPLQRIASGGELSRFMLAIKVVLAATRSAGTLVFDEVDSGVGGAVADKVGERLARLATGAQILVVTHSPQVAARGDHHWRVARHEGRSGSRVSVDGLDAPERREEIARMLAGAEITNEARAAADSLLQAGRL